MPNWTSPGRSTVSPFIIVRDADRVLDFASKVFGARPLRPPLRKSDGRLWNAELGIGDSTIMLGDGGDWERPGFVHVYVEDADATFQAALDAGAEVMMPVEDQFYGDRAGGVTDPAGNIWWIATHVRLLTDAELEAAARAEEARREG